MFTVCECANTLATVCLCADTFVHALTRVCLRVRLCLRHSLFCKLYILLVILAEFSSGCIFRRQLLCLYIINHQLSHQWAKHTHIGGDDQLFTVVLLFSPQGNRRTWGCHGNWPLAPTPDWGWAAPGPDGCSQRWVLYLLIFFLVSINSFCFYT